MDQTSTIEWRATRETLNRSLHMGIDKSAAGAFQAQNLTKLAAIACARSPFYRDRLAPAMGRSGLRLELWENIPILTKDELREHRDSILIADPAPESSAVHMGWTAGSEGEPLQYARTALSDYVSSKTTQRFMRWWKMDGNLHFAQIQASRHTTSASPTPAMRRGWMEGHPAGEHHTYPAITDLQGHLGWLQNIRPAYLKGYPEALGELARLALRQGRVLQRCR